MIHRLPNYGSTGHPSEDSTAHVGDGVSLLGSSNIRSDETAETPRGGRP